LGLTFHQLLSYLIYKQSAKNPICQAETRIKRMDQQKPETGTFSKTPFPYAGKRSAGYKNALLTSAFL